MDKEIKNFGLIAGGGAFPSLAAEQLIKRGCNLKIAAVKGQADEEIGSRFQSVLWVNLGQLKKTLRFFRDGNIKKVIFAGRIKHADIFSIKPDFTAAKLLAGLKDKKAATVLKAVCDLFEKEGIGIMPSIEPVKNMLFRENNYTKTKPDKKTLRDISFARGIVREISNMDIGQAVIVKDGIVVAVEAMEGTDKCILRAGKLAGEGTVCVKVARDNLDTRFDVPVIGIRTVRNLAAVRARAIACQKGRTLFFDREESIKLADENKISITGIE